MSPESNGDLGQWLKQLQVAPPAVDRDRLLYEAGQRSVKRSWAWPMVASICLALSAVSIMTRLSADSPAAPIVQERVVYVAAELKPIEPGETKPVAAIQNDPLSYIAMLQDMVQNKPMRSTATYDSVKPSAIQTAGSYVEWFPAMR